MDLFLRIVMDAGSLVIVSRMMLTMVWMKVMVKVKVMMKVEVMMKMKVIVKVIKIDVSIPTSTRWR